MPTGSVLSTNQAEQLPSPPVTKPRARMAPVVDGSDVFVNCQPPAMRVPAPRLFQSTSLAEKSKAVRQTSGLLPPRIQAMVEPS